MIVQKANLSHLDDLATLFDAYRVFYGKYTNIPAAKQFLTARMHQEESIIYVAEDPNYAVVGFVQLYPLFSSTRMQKLWLLNDLYVRPSSRGNGISIQLIDAAKKLVYETQACGLILETEISNTIGNKLYPRAGFSLDQATNHYFWNAI